MRASARTAPSGGAAPPRLHHGAAQEEKQEAAAAEESHVRRPEGGGMEAPREEGAPEGPPRFQCPEEFSASPFAPGPPFSPEMLQDPSKQLLLIRAPANFSPESLDGHVISLSGFQTLKATQLDKMQKVYSIQPTLGNLGSFAHLLIPSGHPDQLTCAPPFSSSLSIWERYGDPSANQPLLPVADRLAPQIPEGLKQRFLPFGSQLKRPPPPPQEAAEKPPQKKKKKRQLQTVGYMGDPEEQLPLKHEPWEGRGPEMPSGGSMVPAEDSQPSSILGTASQKSLLSAKEEEPSRKSKKKKKKQQQKEEEIVQEERMLLLLNPSSIKQQPELGPCLQGGEPEPHAGEDGSSRMEGLVQRKHKKKRKREEEATAKETLTLMDAASVKEEPRELGWVGGIPECSLPLAGEEPGMGLPSCKSKKKKKKREKAEEEQDGGRWLLDPSSIKQEPLGYDEPEAPSGPGVELEESSEATVEVPRQKHKKTKMKKKELKREAMEEGLDFIKQELKTPWE